MPRRALRPSFVVTFALGAAAIAGGCGSKNAGNGNGSIGDASIGDGSIGDGSIGCGSNDPGDGSTGSGGCPAEQPCNGAPCDLPSWAACGPYGGGITCPGIGPGMVAECQGGTWSVSPAVCTQDPPGGPVYEAGPKPNACTTGPADGGAFACKANDAGVTPANPQVTNPADGGEDTACDTCIEGCCGDAWCACGSDSSINDAGTGYTGCLGIIQCTQECTAGDAGLTATQCFQSCAASFPNSAVNAQTLFTCIAGTCGSGICTK